MRGELKVGNDHWLVGVKRSPSPNADERAVGKKGEIGLIVIHGISLPPNEFGGSCIEELFCNQLDFNAHPFFQTLVHLKVSSHVVIDRQGVMTQFVAFDRRAWHAGESEFRGRKTCNDFSIGIELEGADDIPYESAQYETLAKLVKSLLATYKTIPKDAVVGHSDIAPGRKTDPGKAFDWSRFRGMIAAGIVTNS